MRRSYIAVASALTACMVVQTLNRQWSDDWYLHAAAVRELASRLVDPHHPLIGTSASDPESSPYLAALGAIARLSSLSVVTILAIAAIANLLAFLVVLPRFVRCFSSRPSAPAWTLVFILVLWGVNPWRWSGYLNLNSIGFGLPYPSMAASVLTLLMLVLVHAWCERSRFGFALGAGVAAAMVALVHPPTFLGAAISAGAMLAWKWDRRTTSSWWHLAVAGLLGVVILMAWPLYRFVDLLGATGPFTDINKGIYKAVLARSLLVLITVPALWYRWQRDHRDALALTFVAALLLYVVGGATGQYTLGRVYPVAALAGQVALAVEVAERSVTDRRVWRVAAGISVVGAIFCAGAFTRFVPRSLVPERLASGDKLAPVTSGYSFLAAVPADDVVAVLDSPTRRAEPAFGGKTVSPGYASPFVGDAEERAREEVRLFLTPDDSERLHIISTYSVRWLLVPRAFADDPANARVVALGEVVHRDGGHVLIRLDERAAK